SRPRPLRSILFPSRRSSDLYESEEYQTDDAGFLYDLTYTENDEITEEQEIFEEIYTMIDEAEEFLVLDMFLFNDDYNHDTLDFRSEEHTSELQSRFDLVRTP